MSASQPDWKEVVERVGRDRLEHEDPLVFAYIANVSLEVESAVVALCPTLPREAMRNALGSKHDWLRQRFLKPGWPDSEDDLLLSGLTAAKATLAAGAKVADGSFIEMQDGFWRMFPEVFDAGRENCERFECSGAYAIVTLSGDLMWGHGGDIVREGEAIPVGGDRFGERGALEILLQNAMRLDIQRRIEERA